MYVEKPSDMFRSLTHSVSVISFFLTDKHSLMFNVKLLFLITKYAKPINFNFIINLLLLLVLILELEDDLTF